jgi:hypothetical protein
VYNPLLIKFNTRENHGILNTFESGMVMLVRE